MDKIGELIFAPDLQHSCGFCCWEEWQMCFMVSSHNVLPFEEQIANKTNELRNKRSVFAHFYEENLLNARCYRKWMM